jgi:hypothetical protein
MKRALVITAFLSIALPGMAQAQAPAKGQASAQGQAQGSAQKQPAAKAAAKPAQPVATQVADAPARKSRRGDARHCLEQPSNTAIIKCAEAYL